MSSPWRCVSCGADSERDERPLWCPRCGSMWTFGAVVGSPGVGPGRIKPVQASALRAGQLAPSLGEEFDSLFGRMGRPVKIGAHGLPGSGKTTWALKLAEAFKVWGAVLYCALDEGYESQSFRDKVARLEIRSPYVCGGSWREISWEIARGEWGVVVVDTVQRSQALPEDLDQFSRSSGVSWVVLLEDLKDGATYKGDSAWGHWVDVMVRVEGLRATTEKNRYAACGSGMEVLHV